MSRVRVLVGTRKGAFVLDVGRQARAVGRQRSALRGLGDLPSEGIARRPERLYAVAGERAGSDSSSSAPTTAAGPGSRSATSSPTTAPPARTSGTTARRIRGSSRASGISSRRSTDPDTVYAGVEDAALFRSTRRRPDVAGAAGLRAPRIRARAGSRARAGCACTRSSSIRAIPRACLVAISSAGAFRSDDAARPGGRSTAASAPSRFPTRPPRSVTACIASPCIRSRPDVLFMQKHWDVMRSDDARRVVARGQRQPAERLRLPDRRARARAGDDLRRADQERLGALSARGKAPRLPQPQRRARVGAAHQGPAAADCYVNVLRDAMAVDALDACGIYFGTTGGQVYVSADAGDTGPRSSATCRPCCRSRCRRCDDPRRAPGTPAEARPRRGRGAARRRRGR